MITDPHDLRPELWACLPDELIDVIMDKVLVDIPFSRLLGFCCIGRRWRAFLLKRQYLLYCHKDQCKVFNSRKGVWETVSLQFSQDDGLSLRHLQQPSSTRGLLCLSTDVGGELVVVNPLTKSYRKTGRLVDHDAQTSAPAQTRPFAGVTELTEMILPSGKRGWLAGVVGRFATGPLFFSLAKLRGATFFVNRLEGSRQSIVDDIPRDSALLVGGPKLQYNFGRNMTLGFGSLSGGFRFFAYDKILKQMSDFAYSLPCVTSLRTGETRAVIENEEGALEFWEMQNTGLTLTSAESPFPPSTRIPITDMNPEVWFEILSILLVEDGPGSTLHGIIFLKISGSSLPRFPVRLIDHIVFDSSLELMLKWTLWEPYVEMAGGGTLATRFQIFRPSLSPP